jgi:hypothetical protein
MCLTISGTNSSVKRVVSSAGRDPQNLRLHAWHRHRLPQGSAGTCVRLPKEPVRAGSPLRARTEVSDPSALTRKVLPQRGHDLSPTGSARADHRTPCAPFRTRCMRENRINKRYLGGRVRSHASFGAETDWSALPLLIARSTATTGASPSPAITASAWLGVHDGDHGPSRRSLERPVCRGKAAGSGIRAL